MATLSDIENTLLSGLNHIDALLDIGPDWNYLTPVGNTILYTFSVATANEVRDGVPVTGQQAFTAAQQAGARAAMQYISQVTGIVFTETTNGAAAQVHLCNIDLDGATTTGMCSWQSSVDRFAGQTQIEGYHAQAYVYLDNSEFGSRNANLTAGSEGYETLLHELGHMLGLKHPHEEAIRLPEGQDFTSYTLMSYKDSGGPYATFSDYDIAALNWIYGGDGLRGALGINSTTGARYLTGSDSVETLLGTQFDDTLKGAGGDDLLNGGEGTDTAIFSGTRASYQLSVDASGVLTARGADGLDTLTSIEILQFSDISVQRSQVVDTTAPAAPTATVATNAAGYVVGNTPSVFGIAEASATIKIFNGSNQIGTGKADANGFFNIATVALANGSYALSATATDAAGNASVATALNFKVDATAPPVPTGLVVADAGGVVAGNQPAFNGTGEAGSTISLVNTGNEVLGQATVGASGAWSITPNPLANGNYSVQVRSSDAADNTTSAAAPMTFTVNSTLNRSGTAASDSLSGTVGNNALQGLGGIDTAVYAGARANYTMAKSTNGYTVSSTADGLDSLLGVERVKFGDASLALDIDGNGGQAYRIYGALLNRAPDLAGVGYWIDRMDDGTSLQQVAKEFIGSGEFKTTYGENLSTTSFITLLYANVLHRPLDQAGFDFWVNSIDVAGVTRDTVLMQFSESNENQAQVIGAIGNGFAYTPWLG